MTRATAERLEKLEGDFEEIRSTLGQACERLDQLQTHQSGTDRKLEEIAANLVQLSRAILKSEKGGSFGKQGEGEAEPEPRRIPNVVALPTFEGEDPIGWLARANQQFELHGTAVGSKVAAAVVAMDGEALHWVTWWKARQPDVTWEKFSTALVSQFVTN